MNIDSVTSNYSVALLDSCLDLNRAEEATEELRLFWNLCTTDNINQYLLNLFYDKNQREKLLLEIINLLELSDLIATFIKICFENNRIKDIGIIISNLQSHIDIMYKVKRAEVFSVEKLSDSEIENITNTLNKKFLSTFII